MTKLAAVAVLLCVSSLFSQTAPEAQKKKPAAPRNAATPARAADTAKSEQQERARKLLQTAEAQAGGLQGGMRAYSFLQLSRACEKGDKAKAVELLDDAMTATRDMEDDRSRTRPQLQQQILQAMVPMAPDRAEELLSQIEADQREPVLNALLGHYEKNKDLDHAIELVYRIGQEKEIPYGAVGRIIAALPPEKNGDVLQLFTAAYASYRDHEHPGVAIGGSDFGTLVIQFWRRLPPNLVHDAIRELLKQAEDRKDAKISLASDNGSAAFNSLYEWRLFQLLPVLREVDGSEADDLLRKNEQMKGMLAKYPEGVGSLSPDMLDPDPKPEKGKKGSNTSFSISSGGSARPLNQQGQQMRKLAADADANPATALVQAAAIQDVRERAILYQSIARSAAQKDALSARNALDKLLELVDQLEDENQLNALRTAGDLYLKMGESDQAKKVVERGFALAEKMLKKDTNADDPNKALKAYWPSAEAWRSFTRLAGKISPPWALTQLNEISDPEMKVLAELSLAQGWLNVPTGDVVMMSSSKRGNWMSISRED